MEDERVCVIDVNLNKGVVILLALALVLMSLVGYMAWGRQDASASEAEAPLASSANMREYYITSSWHDGAGADTACASGYHMASLWELMDTSNLKYNSTLGNTYSDSGEGPPSGLSGWVRTGYGSSTSSTPGEGNCSAWTSSDSLDDGTIVWLDNTWDTASDIGVWGTTNLNCHAIYPVWCIGD